MSDSYLEKSSHGVLSKEEQRQAVETAGHKYYYTSGQEFDDLNKKMVIDEIRRFIKPGRMLELGYINNIWTTALLEADGAVDILEAASNHVEKAREDFSRDLRVKVFNTLFEDYV